MTGNLATEFPQISLAFAFAISMLGTHKPQQRPQFQNKTPEIVCFAVALVIQHKENPEFLDSYYFHL